MIIHAHVQYRLFMVQAAAPFHCIQRQEARRVWSAGERLEWKPGTLASATATVRPLLSQWRRVLLQPEKHVEEECAPVFTHAVRRAEVGTVAEANMRVVCIARRLPDSQNGHAVRLDDRISHRIHALQGVHLVRVVVRARLALVKVVVVVAADEVAARC